MKISELIKELEQIKNQEGDLKVTIFDEYTANEGWGYNNKDLWQNTYPVVEFIEDDDENEIEKVVCFR